MRRLTVAECWQSGAALVEIQRRLPHGDWREYLLDAGIKRMMAWRLMRLAEFQLSQIVKFDTMSAALKSLPAAPNPKNDAGADPAADDAREIEQEAARQESEIHLSQNGDI